MGERGRFGPLFRCFGLSSYLVGVLEVALLRYLDERELMRNDHGGTSKVLIWGIVALNFCYYCPK